MIILSSYFGLYPMLMICQLDNILGMSMNLVNFKYFKFIIIYKNSTFDKTEPDFIIQ